MVDPFQEVGLLQRQVEEGVVKVPQQDVLKGLALVRQEALPQREARPVLRDAQQENGADGQSVPKESFPAPGPTDDLSGEGGWTHEGSAIDRRVQSAEEGERQRRTGGQKGQTWRLSKSAATDLTAINR